MTKKVWIVSEYVNNKDLNDSMDKSVKERDTPAAREYLMNIRYINSLRLYEQYQISELTDQASSMRNIHYVIIV